jgi:hypothetical protein
MSKRKDRNRSRMLLESVIEIAAGSPDPGSAATDAAELPDTPHDASVSDVLLAASPDLSRVLDLRPDDRRELTMMKKFRFQLLHQWILQTLPPCRVADIGGGKGLLAYLLQRSGWAATVIDPVAQPLPTKYRDLATGRQIRIPETETVPRLNQAFQPEYAQDFEVLVAMHAHGCNIQLIDAAAQYQRDLILLPCCIIGEPLHPPPATHWLQCVADYAKRQGFALDPFQLNFKGQNIGLYARSPQSRTRS